MKTQWPIDFLINSSLTPEALVKLIKTEGSDRVSLENASDHFFEMAEDLQKVGELLQEDSEE